MKNLNISIVEKDVVDWFSKRDKDVKNYQLKLIAYDILKYLNGDKPIVLGAAPSAGKTIITICLIDLLIKLNPKFKVLILAHGTTILRSQFNENIVEYKPDFSYCEIKSKNDYYKIKNVNVVIAIPQTLNTGLSTLPKFDMFVEDEAHHFYLSKNEETLVKKIIKQTKPKIQLLLTGTSSKFIRLKNKFSLIFVSVKTLFDEGMVSDLISDIVTSKYAFKYVDYNDDLELKNDIKVTSNQTDDTMDFVLDSMVNRLKSRLKNNPKLYAMLHNNSKPISKAITVANSINKTLIACHSIQMAEQVQKYFEKKKIPSLLSHSDNDVDSDNIRKFKFNKDQKILIVVNRGILGLDIPSLETVVDMTGSRNPDMIFQLKARVLRKHPDNKEKLFIKVTPANMVDDMHLTMNFTALLMFDEYYTKYNGKNFSTFYIPVHNKKYKKNTNNVKPSTKKKKFYKYFEPDEMPEIEFFSKIDFFNTINHNKNNEFSTYAFAKVRDILATNLDVKPNITNMTTEEAIQRLIEAHPA